MTHPIERLARFLAVSRRHLLEGAMPSRRVPRRPGIDPDLADVGDEGDDGWLGTPGAMMARWSGPDARLRRVAVLPRAEAPPRAARSVAQPSNENRPSATSLARG